MNFEILPAIRTLSFCITLSIFPLPSLAYEYSIRHAFCTDYAKSKSSILSSSFHYDLQVAYKACMKEANKLIRLHEQQRKESADRSRRQKAEWRQEAEQRKRQEEQRKLQEEQKKRVEEQRIKDMVENLSDIFH